MEHPRNELITSVSNLKGTIVRNVRDEKLGEIEDLVLDMASGQMAYVILLVNSGFMGLENKYFLIPWEAFHYDLSQEQERTVILDMDKKELEAAYGYNNDHHGNGPHGNDRLLNPLKIRNTRNPKPAEQPHNRTRTYPGRASSFTFS